MADAPRRCPGLDLFWEEADLNASGEHPLRRELAHRVDVLTRYERLIVEAQVNGQDDLLHNLTTQHRRELRVIETLQAVLSSSHARADRSARSVAADKPLSADGRGE
jgi:hypothetical protein